MVETLDRLMEHLESQGERPKAVVWAHNSHLGDARATSMSLRGEWNVGQLVREWHEGETASVGFTTFQGTVTAASEWGAAAERKRVRLGLDGSYEELFHRIAIPKSQLDLRSSAVTGFHKNCLSALIGVIYLLGNGAMEPLFLRPVGRAV
jgi:erythromycin esterase-like protein